ncbi:MAG TPA: hypothetical protein VK934_03335 [Fimbriimonas sp.]|nr:hypothetical protein [Fimbriimonas sp.]
MSPNSGDLIKEIEAAFATRSIPECVILGPLDGDELPPGHPGYGKGDPLVENETDGILRYVQGRSWQDIDAHRLQYQLIFFTPEALAYYLPAVLIYNLRKTNPDCTERFFLEAPRYRDQHEARKRLRKELSVEQRQAVAKYISLMLHCGYSQVDTLFWEASGDRSDHANSEARAFDY